MTHKNSWTQLLTGTLAGPLALFAIVVLFYWKLVLTDQYTWLEGPDLSHLILPWLQFQAGEWHLRRFPLWDPNTWFGQPLFGQGQAGSAYPLNWLLFLFPLKNGWMRQGALHWYLVLIHYMAALNAYALCRSLNRSRLASIAGGCVYALGGYVANTDYPQMLNATVWTPLVFLFLLRAERGEKPWSSALLSGFFLGFGWLAGHHPLNLFATIAATGVWVWLCLREMPHGKINWQIAKLAVASLIVAACASAFQTLPMAEFGQRAVRWAGSPNDPVGLDQKVPYPVHEQYSVKVENLLGIFIPGAEKGPDPFVGATAASLAFLGFVLAWKIRQVRWLAAVGLAGLIFAFRGALGGALGGNALGGNSLFHGVIYGLVPLVQTARVPGAGTLLLSIGLAPLCAFGIDLIPEAPSSVWIKRVSWTLAGLGLVITGVAIVGYLRKLPQLENRILLTALTAAMAAGILTAWRMQVLSARLGSVAALGLILFELANVTTFYLPNRAEPERNPYLHQMREHSDLVNYIRSRGIGGRIEYGEDIPYNIGDWYGIETVNTYPASVLENVWNMDVFSPRGQNFFGVRYYLGKKAGSPNQVEVFQGQSGVKVFENPTAFPRAWSVHEVNIVPDVKQARQTLISTTLDASRTAIVVSSAPAVEHCESDEEDVQMPIHKPNYIHLTARMVCKGMVIVTDSWFPGWRATVDGAPAQILEVDGGVRGIVVDKGVHQIDMKYRPLSVLIGGLMTLLAAVVVGIVYWMEVARDSSRSAGL